LKKHLPYLILLLYAKVFSQQAKTIDTDGYSITNEMISEYFNDPNEIKAGGFRSLEKIWFTNTQRTETIIIYPCTDYFRCYCWHFYNNEIPKPIFETLRLYSKKDKDWDIASAGETEENIDAFIKQAIVIDSQYFKTNKGLKLGDSKQKALTIYSSKPDNIKTLDGIEQYEWNFIGDISIEEGIDEPNGKPIAKNSFGHHVTLFFKNNKLVGIILINDIP